MKKNIILERTHPENDDTRGCNKMQNGIEKKEREKRKFGVDEEM